MPTYLTATIILVLALLVGSGAFVAVSTLSQLSDSIVLPDGER